MFELDKQSAGLTSPVSPQFPDSKSETEQRTRDQGQRFVAFFLGGSFYALPSDKVTEVVHPLPVTPLPEMPDWLLGISNLRGEVIAVVNSRRLLGSGSTSTTERSRFLLFAPHGGHAPVALPVDGLDEVLNIAVEDIESREAGDAAHVFGRTRSGDKVFHVIDADEVLASLQASQI